MSAAQNAHDLLLETPAGTRAIYRARLEPGSDFENYRGSIEHTWCGTAARVPKLTVVVVLLPQHVGQHGDRERLHSSCERIALLARVHHVSSARF